MMRELREKTKIIMIIVALAFVGLMVFEWGMDISGTSVASQTGELGRVNGEPVPYEMYSFVYQQLYDQARAASGGSQLSREQVRAIEDQAFNEVVNEILIRQELRRRGIRVSDREIIQAAQWMPHPDLMNNELFQTDGQFDISKYQQFISGPAANEQLLLELENYYRSTIPRSKLMRQVTAGLYVGDAELWQMWRDQTETAMVDYVPLNISVLVPGDVEVTEREIEEYYRANREQFRRPATARVTLAYISKAPTAVDSAVALNRALAVRQELASGGDFAALAQRESDDRGTAELGGLLGQVTRDDLLDPTFLDAAFTIPVGEISEPVQTPFGYHLIRVSERTDSTANVSHILFSYAPTDEALDALYARADSLETLAEAGGVQRAAAAVNAQYRTGVVISEDQTYVPDVGSAIEALEWVQDNRVALEPTEVSPVFETPQAFYIVSEEAYVEPGMTPLSEASAEVRRLVILEKKRERARQIGQEMVAEIRAGKSLEDAARERGLTVESTGPITRTAFNPAFGQANAVTGAAFGVPVGEVSDVVETPGGLFLVRPTSREPADREQFDAQKEQLREIAIFQLQQEAVTRWMEELRANANIVDRRNAVLAPAAS